MRVGRGRGRRASTRRLWRRGLVALGLCFVIAGGAGRAGGEAPVSPAPLLAGAAGTGRAAGGTPGAIRTAEPRSRGRGAEGVRGGADTGAGLTETAREAGRPALQNAHDSTGEAEDGLRVRDVFFVLIAILLLGKLFGEFAERRGQPAVLGELVAGVVLGSSLLGVVPPFDTPTGEIVQIFAEIGVAILLFEIGLETDLKEMFHVGPTAFSVATVGVVVPFGLGFLYWYMINPGIGAHPQGITFAIVAVFVGATLTATSVGITARVLADLKKMSTPEARIIIGAAVIDDVMGIVILAVVSGLAGGVAVGVLSIGKIFLFAVGFLVLAVVIGNRFAPALFNYVDRMRVRGVLLVTAFCFALGVAALADWAGSAMIIGAFAAGIVLSSTNQFDAVVERIEPVADVFTPIFFVAVGAPVNVKLFIPGSDDFDLAVLAVGLILTVIAVIGKIVSGLAVRRRDTSKLLVGVGMIPRGEVGLIFASIGLTAGILSNAVYSAILIMVILSTFIVPPFLKILFQRKDLREAVAAARRPGRLPGRVL
ncbi:MAG: cation:proton antiporter [Gemmatimonadota bacterium]